MTNVRLLTAINVAHTDEELRSLIDILSDQIEIGNLAVESDLDSVSKLYLTAAGRAAWPMTLPTTVS